jgi:hypothetical protein
MNGRVATFRALTAALLVAALGCRPHTPIDFWGPRDSALYAQLASRVETPPELYTETEAAYAGRPSTLQNLHEQVPWDLTLLDALRMALASSPIIRQLPQQAPPIQGALSCSNRVTPCCECRMPPARSMIRPS